MRYWYQEEDSNLAADALIEAYVNGAIKAPLHVLVASGLSLSPQGRVLSQALDSLKGTALDMSKPILLQDHEQKRAQLMKRIEQEEESSCQCFNWDDLHSTNINTALPLALQLYVGCEFAKLNWKDINPRLQQAAFDKVGKVYASLERGAYGVPLEYGGNYEWKVSLILAGSFYDTTRQYIRGNVYIARKGITQEVYVDAPEGCLCYSVYENI